MFGHKQHQGGYVTAQEHTHTHPHQLGAAAGSMERERSSVRTINNRGIKAGSTETASDGEVRCAADSGASMQRLLSYSHS